MTDGFTAPLSGRDATSRDFVIRFTKLLPGWLRRCGVKHSDLDDAVQEAALEVLEKIGSRVGAEGLTEAQARHELMRIVSNVALRVRRRLQRESDRYSRFETNETNETNGASNTRDEEAWVEARALVLTAIGNLDEATRALIFAHEVEGRTNIEIAATLQLKEDAVEKRVHQAKQRLRSEVEHLERGRRKLRGPAVASCFGFVWQSSDPMDQALVGAFHETLGHFSRFPRFSGRTRGLRTVKPNMPTTALMGALVFAPMVPTSPAISSIPSAQKISSVAMPSISVPNQERGGSNAGTPDENANAPKAQDVVGPPERKPTPRPNEKKNVGSGSGVTNKSLNIKVPSSLIVSDLPELRD